MYIIAEILDIAKRGALKTRIMYRANLSFAQLNEYLKFLLWTKMIEPTKVHDARTSAIYKTTKKGEMYLRNYQKIKHLLKIEKSTLVDRFREVRSSTKEEIDVG